MEIVEEGNEAETAGPMLPTSKGCPDLFPATFWIGRSRVMEEDLYEFDEHGLIKALPHSLCHTLGREEVPKPEPYEVVVFWDFFEAGLHFPCEDFVNEVLPCFNLQIHQLTPNAFARIGVLVMELNMTGYALSVDTFACYYETQLHKKTIKGQADKIRGNSP